MNRNNEETNRNKHLFIYKPTQGRFACRRQNNNKRPSTTKPTQGRFKPSMTKPTQRRLKKFTTRLKPKPTQRRLKPNKKRPHNNHNNHDNKRDHKLNTSWTIYVHNIHDKDWTLESYKKVFTINSIEDFWVFFNNFTRFQEFNFYMMREDIMPVYEDKANVNGGSYSYIISGKAVKETFIHVLMKMIGELLVNTDNHREITGVSLVPKRGTSILKVWLANKENPLELNLSDIKDLRSGRFQIHRMY